MHFTLAHSMKRVFPAYAGVFLFVTLLGIVIDGVPRIRGGVPIACSPMFASAVCSPHTRGCSCYCYIRQTEKEVFPAYAGVFLLSIDRRVRGCCVPRIRGGVPIIFCGGKCG